MTTAYPTGLDNITKPQGSLSGGTDKLSTTAVIHGAIHQNEIDAIQAIEAKLGVDSSAVTSSIDYLLKNTSSINPGHKHTAVSITGFIASDGTITTTASIPLALGASLGGTPAAPVYSMSFDGTNVRFGGTAINGANLYILPNQAADNLGGPNVFVAGATATGDPVLQHGGVMIGTSVIARPAGTLIPQINFLGVGGNLTVGDYAEFQANMFVGGVPPGIQVGVATIAIQGQAARSIGVERAQGAVSIGQPLTINAGGSKSGTTNINGGNLTLSPGAATGTGSASTVIQATGGGSSGTSTKAASTVATFAVGAVTLADAYNITVNTTTGTKIGTTTTGKLGFWNATPIVQPANTVAIDTLLVNTGLRASGGLANFATKLGIPSLAASTTEGDFWSDSTQKSLATFTDGIKQMLSGCVFTQTADKTVANTLTETSIVGTGVGGLTLPANFFVAGKTVRITMSGVYSTVAVTGDTVTIKIKYGSTVLASKATTALVTGGTNLAWFADALITCRSTGASGTVQVSGGIRYQIAGSAIIEDELNNGVTTTTLDTTASGLLDVTVTHGAANASNTVKSLVSSFEVLN